MFTHLRRLRTSLYLVGAMVPVLTSCRSAPPEPLRASPAPAVYVVKAAKSDSTQVLRVSGTLEAESTTNLSFGVVGTVAQVFVKEGQFVRRGQVIARVSPGNYQDALAITRSKAAQAEDAQRRLKPMYDNKTLPEVKMVEVDSGVEQARLAVSIATKNLDDTTLRAPSDGIIAKRYAEPGTTAAPGVPIVGLVQTKIVLAAAPVPEMRVSKLKLGDKGRVFVTALNQWFEGSVRDIALAADPLTRTYTTRIALNNRDAALRVGMVADIELPLAGESSAVVVPPEAIRIDAQGTPQLFVVRSDNLVEQRPVKVSGYVGEGAAIAQGLVEGEVVITSGTSMLETGMLVRIVEHNAALAMDSKTGNQDE